VRFAPIKLQQKPASPAGEGMLKILAVEVERLSPEISRIQRLGAVESDKGAPQCL